ncbi:erythromycin esterase [Paenibacillus oralis]|uniref:Erythromycin esterase n=1 Tax=Paenibacillus oralis TaxID=2490856 RepID=A0A3P3U3V7_9BACL|nr:erythromycin esterase family protein [Paenibacillus oralis]RRJ65047.1 erythromycin esterase [Paenibacillus oralis]
MKQQAIKFKHAFTLGLITAIFLGSALIPETKAASGESSQSIQGTVIASGPARTAEVKIKDWEAWANDHAYKLETIQPVDASAGRSKAFQDLSMLKPLLLDKRIVFLGESSHGVAEFSLAKTRLIQFLHEEMGYNVLAFESGLANTSLAYGKSASQSAEQTMKDAIFGVWWSKETLPLFDYIKATQQSDQPLALTGFDMQLQYPLLDGGWIQDKAMAERLADAEQKLSDYSNGTDLKGYKKDKNVIIRVYNDILKDLKSAKTQATLKERYPDNVKLPVLLERSLNERIRFAKEYAEISIRANLGMQTGDYAPFFESMEWRDKTMLDNLMWLATEVYPTEKFIVWGHNDHIRKAHSEVMGTPYPVKLMGELLPDEMKKYSYAIGLYPSSGKTADNTKTVHDVLPLAPGSVESILSAAKTPFTFIDLRYQSRERGNSWMFEPRFAYSWGIIPESLVPRDQYDGLLLIDGVNPPQYLTSKPAAN